MHNNQNGFTLVELLVASAVSLVLLAVLAGVVTSQGNIFSFQNHLNEMQANGRGATEFISRAVGNAGYNVVRGTKFQAASDNYISAIYDADNDGVIQNTEVQTFTIGNNFAATTQTFNISPFFDRDGNGTVGPAETAVIPINMTQTAPPFNLYQILPDNAGTGVTRNIVARNIDNIIIRYYDNSGLPLPTGVAVDVNGLPIPPYNFAAVPAQMNQIRRVDVQILARTKDPHPSDQNLPQGTYVTGSVAALVSGSTNYTDGFSRQTFTVSQSPRNLVLAPWGKMDVEANPQAVNCPTNTSTVTATLVDAVGDPIDGTSVNFAPAGLGATVNPTVATTNGLGQATTQVSYDWTSSNASITVAASSLVPDGTGTDRPVFSSSIASFQSGTGTFTDLFEGGLDPGWEELDNLADIDANDADAVPGDDSLIMTPSGFITRAVNGCSWQEYQVEFELTPNGDINDGRFVGGYLRYANVNNNYSFLVYRKNIGLDCAGAAGGLGKNACLKITHWNGFFVNDLATIEADFDANVQYKMLAQVEDDFLRAKIWDPLADDGAGAPLGLADPNPGDFTYVSSPPAPPVVPPLPFENVYRIEIQDATIANGQIGLLGDWTNGVSVVFDNFFVTPIN